MSRQALRKSKDISTLKAQFKESLLQTWRKDSHAHMGLAISGGVDSMAIATLCNEVSQTFISKIPFTGFIVDHGLRPESKLEAQSVATELRRLNIEPQILTLDWAAYGGDATTVRNFEDAARTLRYQAIGRACREKGIRSLLVAHHADDQAETVLMRIIANYVGDGLRGMQSAATLPTCAGIHGVGQSGDVPNETQRKGRMLVESGGVVLRRPLLEFTKEQLVEICTQAGTKWFEDATNQDRNLTMRNTLRYLLKQDVLPMALRRERLLEVAEKTKARVDEAESAAEASLKQMPVEVDLRVGTVVFKPKSEAPADSELEAAKTYRRQLVVLRRLILLVSPSSNVNLHALHKPMAQLQDPDYKAKNTVQVGGVSIQPRDDDSGRWVIKRTTPKEKEAKDITMMKGTEWLKWDNRYWIRALPAMQGLEVGIGFLTKDDIVAMRKSLPRRRSSPRLNAVLDFAPGDTRFTLPAIIVPSRHGDKTTREVVALPSLNWSAPGWRRWPDGGILSDRKSYWDIRFRKMDFQATGVHKLNDFLPDGGV